MREVKRGGERCVCVHIYIYTHMYVHIRRYVHVYILHETFSSPLAAAAMLTEVEPVLSRAGDEEAPKKVPG